MPLPSLTELGQAEFMSPMMFQQAQEQMGLGMQQAQQGLDKGKLDMAAQSLANIFAEKQNPQLLEQTNLMNQGRALENRMNTVKANDIEALAPEAREAKRAEMLAKMGEDELKQLTAKGETLSIRGAAEDDPVMEARGKKMMEAGRKEMESRYKGQVALDKMNAQAQGRLEGIAMQQSGANQRNANDNATKLQVAQQRAASIAAKAKDNPKNAEAAAVHYQLIADSDPDPEVRAEAAENAKKYAAYSMALKNAQAGNKPDMAQFGIQTNPVNLGIGTASDSPMRNAPPRTSGAGDPPAGAGLVQNEARRAAVDLSAVEEEYARATDPKIRAVLAEQIKKERAYKDQVSKPTAPQAKAGYIVIFKDGKPVGQIPAANAEKARAQGYSLN